MVTNSAKRKKRAAPKVVLKETEFMALTTIITSMEERLHKEIKGTREDIQAINGRVRTNEGEIIAIKKDCTARDIHCKELFAGITPISSTMKTVNWITKNWKTSILLFILILMGAEAIVVEAIENKWLSELLKYFKP